MGDKKQCRLPAEERKKQIFEKALKLFAEKGFEETKTKEIAAAAGISEAAMFKHFKNKEELIVQSLEYKFGCEKAEQKAAFLASMEMSESIPEEALKLIGNRAIELMEHNIDLARVMIYSMMKHPAQMRKYLKQNMQQDERIFKKLVEQGIKNGTVKKLDPNIIGPIFPIMMFALTISNYLIEGKPSTDRKRKKLVDTMVEIYLHGVLENK